MRKNGERKYFDLYVVCRLWPELTTGILRMVTRPEVSVSSYSTFKHILTFPELNLQNSGVKYAQNYSRAKWNSLLLAIQSMEFHESWNTPDFDHDICIVTLKEPLNLDDPNVAPIEFFKLDDGEIPAETVCNR